jgi:hypothetical protein
MQKYETRASERGTILFGGDVVSECGFILHLEAVGYSIMMILIHKSRWC